MLHLFPHFPPLLQLTNQTRIQKTLSLLPHSLQPLASPISPIPTRFQPPPHTPNPPRPHRLHGTPLSPRALARNHTHSLEDSLAAIAPKHRGVVNPLQTTLEFRIEGRDDSWINARCCRGAHAGIARDGEGARGRWLQWREVRDGRGGGEGRRGGFALLHPTTPALSRQWEEGQGAGGRWRRDGRQAALGETFEDGAGLCEEVGGAVVLGAGDEGEGACEHVGCEELHAALDDRGVGRDGRGWW